MNVAETTGVKLHQLLQEGLCGKGKKGMNKGKTLSKYTYHVTAHSLHNNSEVGGSSYSHCREEEVGMKQD